MRALTVVFAAACCVLGPGLIAPSEAQTADWFELQVCNKSSINNVSVAITSKADQNGGNWQVVGWYNIPDRGCMDLGGYWRDKVYIYAFGDNGAYWGGSDTTQCVNLSSKFSRTFSSNYNCASSETSVGFSVVTVPSNVGTYTMNLN